MHCLHVFCFFSHFFSLFLITFCDHKYVKQILTICFNVDFSTSVSEILINSSEFMKNYSTLLTS